jgi:hypothetical protein
MVAVIFNDVAEYLDEVSTTQEKKMIDANLVRLTFTWRHGEAFISVGVFSSFTCCGEVVQLRHHISEFMAGAGPSPADKSKMESARDKIENHVRKLNLELRGGAHRFASEFGK